MTGSTTAGAPTIAQSQYPYADHGNPYTGPLRILTPSQIPETVDRQYLMKGVVNPGELSVWYGAPGCGKSFLILALAYSIARGEPIFDRRVRKARVLYLSLENEAGFERRVAALKNEFGDPETFFFAAQPLVIQQETGDTLNEIIRAVKILQCGLVIIDTLNRALGGGSENESSDMGQLIQSLDRIKQETGAHVAIVHHKGKSVEKGPRGHSSLIGAADVIVEVSRSSQDTHKFVVEKAKDDIDGDRFGFCLETVVLGKDADDDEITTCRAVEAQSMPHAATKARLNPTEQGWLSDIRELFATDVPLIRQIGPDGPEIRCVTRDELYRHLITNGRVEGSLNSPKSGAARKQMSINLSRLHDKGRIGRNREFVWLLDGDAAA